MLAKRYNVVQMRQFFSSKSCVRLLSLPMRGEWIEMFRQLASIWPPCLSPCGESGLKSLGVVVAVAVARLSPCGESGLKWSPTGELYRTDSSLPMRGEWIEIQFGHF